MTLTSLWGGNVARDPATMAGNAEYYNLDRADVVHGMQGHEWKSTKSEMKKTKSTLSALTLLAFLFFLNLLLSCLKDTVQSGNPDIIVMPQQRVTRGVLSGQLTGAVGVPAGVQADAVDPGDGGEEKIADSVWSRIAHGFRRSNHTNLRSGAGRRGGRLDVKGDDDDKQNAGVVGAERGGRRFDVKGNDDDDDGEVSVETEDVVDRRGYAMDETALLMTQAYYDENNKDTDKRKTVEAESDIDRLRTTFWPCCSNVSSRRAKAIRGDNVAGNNLDVQEQLDEDYETALETPETLRATEIVPLDETGVEPEHLGWETVDFPRPRKGTGLVLVDVEGARPGWTHEGSGENKQMSIRNEDVEKRVEELKGNVENSLENLEDVDEELESTEDDAEGEEDDEEEDADHALAPYTTWDAVKVLLRALGRRVTGQDADPSVWEALRGLGRRVVGKGWEESLESLQIPGSQFFTVGDQLAMYAMPIVRDTSTMLGLARCKELVVCETSRLSEMFADEEVTDIFHGVFKWMYGMKEPELRSIAKDGEKKHNCKHFVKRCNSETQNRSWLPMIANVLDFFIT